MSGRGAPSQGGTDEFASLMADLKAEGAAVLVTGEAAASVEVDVCRRLLGGDATAPRRRVLAFPDGAYAVDPRLPASAVGSDAQVVTASTTRSAAAAESSTPGATYEELGDASLADVGVAMAEAVAAVDRRHGPLAPTELRLCVDSLGPVLDEYDGCAVVQFLLVFARLVRRFDALGHVHLPVPRDSYQARLLAPLFDAVVEVRVEDGRPEQRWHLDDGATSRWLPV